jgi:hypothetical protein
VERLFQDIRITGLDTHKSHEVPSQDGTHRLYLTLSNVPPATWRDIFHRERSHPRSSLWRDATIDGMFLVMTCTPEELEKYHLELLKDDVKKTNEQYKLSIVEQEEQSARFRQSEEERKKRLEDVSSRLKFD